jgi:hypothetical protein
LREDRAALIHEPLSLRKFKSRQAQAGFNLLRSYYLQLAPCKLTGQQCAQPYHLTDNPILLWAPLGYSVVFAVHLIRYLRQDIAEDPGFAEIYCTYCRAAL